MKGFAIILYLYFINVVTFFCFAGDKRRAVVQATRIPEAILFLLSSIGGSFGALMGMLLFRHKTLHKSFRIWIPILLTILVVILALLGYLFDVLPDLTFN